ncbi:CHRD domain-containing protein [Limibacter armeniacum]|uniref:CHRD domain-containing protein n=1 Tax=Limibacter armeniacum TaxID=466084 RepID=UPI002FE58AC2
MKQNTPWYVLLLLSLFVISSCDDDDDGGTTPTPDPEIVQEWTVELSPSDEVPAITGRDETGTAELTLYDDNTLEYTITVNDLSDTDELTMAHIHTGGPTETGDVLITLVDGTDIVFDSNNSVTNTIDLTTAQVDSLTNSPDNLYVNVHSTEEPNGLLRGQLEGGGGGTEPEVVQEWEVALSPKLEVPAVADREETGMAKFTLYDNNELIYEIMVDGLAETDELTAAHIHTGNPAQSGDVLFTLVDGTDIVFTDNMVTDTLTLTEEEVTTIQGMDLYVNVHSTEVPSGLVRGQLDVMIDMAADVPLAVDNETDPLEGRTETGTAILRMTADSVLFYSLEVEGLDAEDMLTMAHIHAGAAGADGDVIVDLLDGVSFEDVEGNQFVQDSVMVTDVTIYETVTGGDAYVNIHSNDAPSGLVRGQVDENRTIITNEEEGAGQ